MSHCRPLKLPRNWIHNLVFWSVWGFDSPDFRWWNLWVATAFSLRVRNIQSLSEPFLFIIDFSFSFHYSRLKEKVVWFTGANVSLSLFSKVHLYSIPYSLDKRSQWVATCLSIDSRCVAFYIIWRTQKQTRKAVTNSKKGEDTGLQPKCIYD